MRDGKGVDQEGRGNGKELGEVEREETIIRTYSMRKQSIFNKQKKIKKNGVCQSS